MEIVDMLERRRVDICSLQETRWKSNDVSFIGSYKLFWNGQKPVYLKTPKVTSGTQSHIPSSEIPLICGDLNGHVENKANEFHGFHGGFGYGSQNEDVAKDTVYEGTSHSDTVLLVHSRGNTGVHAKGMMKDPKGTFKPGQPCYVKYYGPRRDRQARWVPAKVVRRLGRRHILVKSIPHGLLWKRHLEQIRPRYGANQNGDQGEITGSQSQFDSRHSIVKPATPENSQVLFDPMFLPRRSERIRHKFSHKL
ncbi:hypothetical protein HELRODRAFT_165024 [Helobdella robusta]|uniref:Endonuclease/exonuclease/phosphatase domain-containing protein n=1 Tax=Helobdella robusta TaxID=6412 RepID=T1EW57_HELRO|nr:hypothetical protein HELRODRAFT_165024 [Helobdella robusta]ESN92892.1 hypothetical protein HELRODRAFT_165024 [Helobdella robusta]